MCMQNCTFNPQSPFNLLKLKIKVREDNRLNPEKFFHLFLHLPEKFSVILSKLLAFPLFHPFFFFIQTTKSIYPSLHQLFESLVVQPPWTTLQSQSKLTLNFCLHTRAVSWDDPALPVPCQELLLLALWHERYQNDKIWGELEVCCWEKAPGLSHLDCGQNEKFSV